MRRPHVYERSAPRAGRVAYQEPVIGPSAVAQKLAAALADLVEQAEAAGLTALAATLVMARDEATRAADR